MWGYLGKWKRRASCCAPAVAEAPVSGPLVTETAPGGLPSHNEPVVVAWGVIERLFFGGEGVFDDYDSAKRAIADRKSGYESVGYFGPVPWVMRNARTGQFIESGS
jgi:hypothetical protein